MSESMEQILFVNWMRKNHPEHRIFAIPNGGNRNPSEAMRLKNEGVSAGVPDLFIPSLRLFIEMKNIEGGTVSSDQKDWIKYLKSIGYEAEVCAGNDIAQSIIEIYLLKSAK